MFLLNSCLSHFSAAGSLRRPFSRSYGAILPSSLTTLLPPALGFSPHPPVSVYGTGTYETIAAFLDSMDSGASLLLFRSPSRFGSCRWVCLPAIPLRLDRSFHSRLSLSSCVPTVLSICSTGISTCYPSTTSFELTQGRSALPWKPWIFGRKDSHLTLATHSGILSSQKSTAPSGTASPL